VGQTSDCWIHEVPDLGAGGGNCPIHPHRGGTHELGIDLFLVTKYYSCDKRGLHIAVCSAASLHLPKSSAGAMYITDFVLTKVGGPRSWVGQIDLHQGGAMAHLPDPPSRAATYCH
jgi:hypothetical protein